MTEIDVNALPNDDWETVVSAGIELAQNMDAHRWQLGDLAGRVEKRYGEDALGKFGSEIGMANNSTLRGYKRVAARFGNVARETWGEAGMTFSHFRAAMVAGDDAELWLAKAADDGLTVNALARAIKEATGKPVPPRKLYEGRGRILEDVNAWPVTEGMRTWMVLLTGPIEAELTDGQIFTVKLYEVAE